MLIPETLNKIAKDIYQNHGISYVVGGAVRDWIMHGYCPKDYDIEVHNLNYDELKSILSRHGNVDEVGQSFGVMKLTPYTPSPYGSFDFSIPRRDNKTGVKHTDFKCSFDPYMGLKEATMRRDFTINTLAYNIITKEVLDPLYISRDDIFMRTLRHVGSKFNEDPLRVLRGVQFYARFDMNVAPGTMVALKKMCLKDISQERIWMEIAKLLLKARKPSKGFILMDTLGLLEKLMPEVKALQGVEQDPEWHPEGDVFVHTMMVIDEAAKLRKGDHFQDLCLMLGALCHDFGKPKTTQFIDDKWRSKEHSIAGVDLTKNFIKRFVNYKELNDIVQKLVQYHLVPGMWYRSKSPASDKAIRRMSMKVYLPLLVNVAKADAFGRTTHDAIQRLFPAGDWLLDRAEHLQVKEEKPKPILRGKHLIDLGLCPGPHMGRIIKESFEYQLDGEITNEEEAIAWAKPKVESLLVSLSSSPQ